MHFLRSNVTKVCMHACISVDRYIYIYIYICIYIRSIIMCMYSLCSVSTSIRICVSAHGCPLSVVLLQPCWLIVYDSSLYQSHCKHHTLKGSQRYHEMYATTLAWVGWFRSCCSTPTKIQINIAAKLTTLYNSLEDPPVSNSNNQSTCSDRGVAQLMVTKFEGNHPGVRGNCFVFWTVSLQVQNGLDSSCLPMFVDKNSNLSIGWNQESHRIISLKKKLTCPTPATSTSSWWTQPR